MQVRPMTDPDIDAIAELHVRTWRSAYAGIIPADYLDALDPADFAERRRHHPVPPGARTLVADDDGTIVGFASFGPARTEDGDVDRQNGELYAIYVDPAHQGRGVGRTLLEEAKRGLRAAGFPRMRLWVLTENHPSRRFYERMGLAPDGTTHVFTPWGSTAELPELRYATPL